MDRWKSRGGKSQGRERRERIGRQKVQVREKSRNNVFFQCCAALEAQKSRLAKVAGVEPSGQMRDDKLHAWKSKT